MKILFSFLFFSVAIFAQTDHPTISNLEVFYKDSENIVADSLKLVNAQGVITIKNSADASLLHFKIINETDLSVIYECNYSFNSSPVTNADGFLLFKKDNNVCYINSPIKIPLKVYLYQVTTEDSNGVLTEVYSDFK